MTTDNLHHHHHVLHPLHIVRDRFRHKQFQHPSYRQDDPRFRQPQRPQHAYSILIITTTLRPMNTCSILNYSTQQPPHHDVTPAPSSTTLHFNYDTPPTSTPTTISFALTAYDADGHTIGTHFQQQCLNNQAPSTMDNAWMQVFSEANAIVGIDVCSDPGRNSSRPSGVWHGLLT